MHLWLFQNSAPLNQGILRTQGIFWQLKRSVIGLVIGLSYPKDLRGELEKYPSVSENFMSDRSLDAPEMLTFSLDPLSERYPLFHSKAFKFKDQPILLKADTITYDQASQTTHAQGRVTLQQGPLKLQGPEVRYQDDGNRILVPCPFTLESTTGDRLWAHKAVIYPRKKSGQWWNVKLLSTRGEYISARSLEHLAKGQDIGHDVIYTPCRQCKDQKRPLWHLEAARVERDTCNNLMKYEKVYLKMKGTTVLYLPKLSMPLKRSTGFLMPIARYTKELGVVVGAPYYWAPTVSNDLTLTPYATTLGGVLLAADWRQALAKGGIRIQGALNVNHPQTFTSLIGTPETIAALRGYIDVKAAYKFTDHWELSMKECRTTDATFFSTRPFFGNSTAAILESSTMVRGLYPNHYFQVRGLHYQDLQDTSNPITPAIYPEIRYNYASPPLWRNSTIFVDVGSLSLYQKQGALETLQRGTVDITGYIPLTRSIHWDSQIILKGFSSLYRIKQKIPLLEEALPYDYLASQWHGQGVFFPQVALESRWPLSHCFPKGTLLCLTPQVQLIAGPSSIPRLDIPNVDSEDLNFSDTNLWALNRFTGYDRLDYGSRMNYGFTVEEFYSWGGHAEVFIGQSYAMTPQDPLLKAVGITQGLSPVVGRVVVSLPNSFIKLGYRGRYGGQGITFQELIGQVGPPLLCIAGGYTMVTSDPFPVTVRPYNQLFFSLQSLFQEFWKVRLFATQNIATPYQRSRTMDKGIGITYEDECFACGVTLQHSLYQFRDLRPGYTFDFYINFKGLGGFALGGLSHVPDRFPRLQSSDA